MHKTIIHFSFEIHEPTDIWSAVRWIRIMLRTHLVPYTLNLRGFFFIIQNPQVSEIFFQFIGEISAWAIKIPNSTETYFTYFTRHKFKISHETLMSSGDGKCFTTET